MAKRRRYPPNRLCEDCGLTFRAWSGIRCPGCNALRPEGFERLDTREARRAQKLAELSPSEPPDWGVH